MITQQHVAAFLKAIRPYCSIQDAGQGEYIIDGVVNVEAALTAALASPEVETVRFKGAVFVVHPDFPPHYWDGEQMRLLSVGATTI